MAQVDVILSNKSKRRFVLHSLAMAMASAAIILTNLPWLYCVNRHNAFADDSHHNYIVTVAEDHYMIVRILWIKEEKSNMETQCCSVFIKT